MGEGPPFDRGDGSGQVVPEEGAVGGLTYWASFSGKGTPKRRLVDIYVHT